MVEMNQETKKPKKKRKRRDYCSQEYIGNAMIILESFGANIKPILQKVSRLRLGKIWKYLESELKIYVRPDHVFTPHEERIFNFLVPHLEYIDFIKIYEDKFLIYFELIGPARITFSGYPGRIRDVYWVENCPLKERLLSAKSYEDRVLAKGLVESRYQSKPVPELCPEL